MKVPILINGENTIDSMVGMIEYFDSNKFNKTIIEKIKKNQVEIIPMMIKKEDNTEIISFSLIPKLNY